MSTLDVIIIGNFGIWILLISILFILIGNKFSDNHINFLFFCFLFALCLLDISDIIDFYFTSLDTLSYWRYIGSISGYILRPLIVIIITLILLRREKSKHMWFLWIPITIFSLLVITTPFTHWLFYFADNNAFMRGPIGYLPHFVSGIYLALLIFLSILYSSKFDKTELITICIISLFSILATVLESIMNFKFLLTSALTISCIVYYLYFLIRQSKIDTLTGLHNRQCFFLDIEKIKQENVVLIMCDLNGLKAINDTGGHSTGDNALKTLSNSLLKAGNKNFRVYRTGGDEFMIIGFNRNIQETNKYIQDVKQILSKTQYMASFGYSFYKKGMSFDDCINKSDISMYKDKDNYKHR